MLNLTPRHTRSTRVEINAIYSVGQAFGARRRKCDARHDLAAAVTLGLVHGIWAKWGRMGYCMGVRCGTLTIRYKRNTCPQTPPGFVTQPAAKDVALVSHRRRAFRLAPTSTTALGTRATAAPLRHSAES